MWSKNPCKVVSSQNGLVFIFKDWANKGWFFCSGKVLLSLGAFSQIPLSHFYLKCCLHLQKRRKIPNCIWAGGFVSAVLQCLHIPTILLKRFFQSNFFGLKWPVVNFHTFGGSNKAQISIFRVKCLRDPTTTGAQTITILHTPEGASHCLSWPVETCRNTLRVISNQKNSLLAGKSL